MLHITMYKYACILGVYLSLRQEYLHKFCHMQTEETHAK